MDPLQFFDNIPHIQDKILSYLTPIDIWNAGKCSKLWHSNIRTWVKRKKSHISKLEAIFLADAWHKRTPQKWALNITG